MKNSLTKKQITVMIIGGVGLLSVLLFQAVLRLDQVTYRSRADETTNVVEMMFDPATVNPGTSEFTTVIKAKTAAAMNIQGYSFNLDFDKTKLEVKTITYKMGVVTAGLGDDTSKVAAVNTRGSILIRGEVQNEAGKTVDTTGAEVVSITFKPKSSVGNSVSLGTSTAAQFTKIETNGALTPITATLARLTVNTDNPPTSTVAPSQGTSPTRPVTPSVTSGPTTNPTTGVTLSLTLKLKFQGIAQKPEGERSKMNVKVTVVSNSNQKYDSSAQFEAGPNGVWTGTPTFNGLKAGDGYRVFVKGPYHIQKKVCVVTPTEQYPGSYRCQEGKRITLAANQTLDFSQIVLMAGDLPQQDGLVDSYDLSLIRNNLGKKEDLAVRSADVNRDGIVDAQDYALVVASLSTKFDEED